METSGDEELNEVESLENRDESDAKRSLRTSFDCLEA